MLSLVLIDGSNFYFKLKNYGIRDLTKFCFTSFAQRIVLSGEYNVFFYIGAISTDKNEKSKRLFASQVKLLAHLKKQNVVYKLGYLLKTNGVYHEKGVDVQIAVDMVVASYQKELKQIFLVSSDTDLLPAIKVAQALKVPVCYVGFKNHLSKALQSDCAETIIVKKDLVESCLLTPSASISVP